MSVAAAATPAYQIIVAQTETDIQKCYDVRIAVFHVEQKFPLETEIDDYDPTGTHFLLSLTHTTPPTPIGTIRVNTLDSSRYKLSRLAILKPYRKYGLGKVLVERLHEWVIDDREKPHRNSTGDVEIICHSQIPVKGFYSKFGYQPEGTEFDEDGDPHQKMVLRLSI